jgi:2-oxo-4-hydroxy-4-carboxy--5-ureidoimidazoline (OHCU) decarboxylase
MADMLSISLVNELTYEDFIGRFGNVVEHCSICAAAVWRNRPFRDVHHLHQEICSFMDLLPDTGSISFQNRINAYSRLI